MPCKTPLPFGLLLCVLRVPLVVSLCIGRHSQEGGRAHAPICTHRWHRKVDQTTIAIFWRRKKYRENTIYCESRKKVTKEYGRRNRNKPRPKAPGARAERAPKPPPRRALRPFLILAFPISFLFSVCAFHPIRQQAHCALFLSFFLSLYDVRIGKKEEKNAIRPTAARQSYRAR